MAEAGFVIVRSTRSMADIVFVLVTIAFFAIGAVVVRAVEKL
jgi:hypothetical protein